MIEYGDADVMVAGGAEAAITELSVGGFASARALSNRNDDPATASRPWDKDRDGFVIGEGAGVLVLEEYEHAKARGARIYAELSGYGMSADAYHMTAPNMDGPRRSMVNALKNAGINPDDVQFMNAHGTSTPYNDKGIFLLCKTSNPGSNDFLNLNIVPTNETSTSTSTIVLTQFDSDEELDNEEANVKRQGYICDSMSTTLLMLSR